jgi:transcriptional regulator NrdR family protein
MNCPKCDAGFSVINDTRHGEEVGRDRSCSDCGFTWRTVERVEDSELVASGQYTMGLTEDELRDGAGPCLSLQDEVAFYRDEILRIRDSAL